MNRGSTPIPEPAAQLQRQLEQFRSAQPGADDSCRNRCGRLRSSWPANTAVHPVAHPLRLDYMKLKKRLGGSPTSRRKAATSRHSWTGCAVSCTARRMVSFRQGCVRLPESGFLLGQEAADRGSADLKSAGDLRFADAGAM